MTSHQRLPVLRDPAGVVSWVHFGDLHIQTQAGRNYRDFLQLIGEVNAQLLPGIDFAVLPGDNADDGTEEQYALVRDAIDGLKCPVFVIPGDHDRKSGDLSLFRRHLQDELWRSFSLGQYKLIFLNALDGPQKDVFDFSPEQLSWLEAELERTVIDGPRAVLFMHAYPGELKTTGHRVKDLIRRGRVLLVDMGHTHYNEVANDGQTIYSATRSTGQIEEGPVGFSITNLDDGVVSWKFKPLDGWPFAMITSPADRRLIVDSARSDQLVRGAVEIRAKAWGAIRASVQVDAGEPLEMSPNGSRLHWKRRWDSTQVSNGEHQLTLRVFDREGRPREDSISVLVRQDGVYAFPFPGSCGSANSIGAWPAKGLLGTQLGPNKNGRKW